MKNFERNQKPLDALDLGLKTLTDKRILKLLEMHSNFWDAPLVVEHIGITEDHHIAVYYAPTSDNLSYNIADIYWRKHLRESNLNFFIEPGDPIFKRHPDKEYMRIIEYIIKPEYINAFEPGTIYKLDIIDD